MENWQALLIFITIRLLSVFLVQTWYVPDEYWQSLEVAHKLVFGYGELTWEWKNGLRSYIYPLIISFIYKILQFLHLDTVFTLTIIPRILQGLLSAYADYRFYHWSGTKKWAVFIMGSTYFWFYTSSRTLINSFETALTTIALSYFPWPNKTPQKKRTKASITRLESDVFIYVVAFLCAVRPTAAIQWLPLCLFHLKTSTETYFQLVFKKYLPIGLITLFLSCLIDSWAHGSFVITHYEFLKANVLNNISEFYGSHSWHWYLSNGLPVLLGINFFPFIWAAFSIVKHRETAPNELVLLGTMVFTISVYSWLPHKEYRFILPLLPMALHILADYLSKWSRKANLSFVWIISIIILLGNVIPGLYLSLIHQRGTLDVMQPLQEIAEKQPDKANFLFLTPCHSTPLYSHLHVNVTTRYLKCVPNLNDIKNYKDEADVFYSGQNIWIRQHYPAHKPLPSHIIAFDVLIDSISDILSMYKPVNYIFHTDRVSDGRIGKNIVVFERIDTVNTPINTATS
ncbi:GPI mannosyltransferase 3 [Onthophagus taurus]|uniref:GPI mannosyltransferase 3 n=1 Tax=Onthophagus taurus TaxID=166361 RepID=UPI000C1FE0FE|nr:GPI mannosyltransferase 3 [Onthophagus taurus]XP_022904246.1 GPI mannosyltransferase 3 [Onthophagus taurus]XP_022904247.1 GPI mannosyltransferase 3 [Onthophagus taurus]